MLQSSSSSICSRAKQILVDARWVRFSVATSRGAFLYFRYRRLELLSRRKSPNKKSPRKTPKKTPRKSPRGKRRTPTSSSKKRLALQFRMLSEGEDAVPSTSGGFRASVTKRALFQSPDHDRSGSKSLAPSTSGLSFGSNNPKRSTPKRALFTSPEKNSPSKRGNIFDRKRKRSDSEDFQPAKFARSLSLDMHPSGSEVEKATTLQRRQSECSGVISRGVELSAHHKKVRKVFVECRFSDFLVFSPKFCTSTLFLMWINHVYPICGKFGVTSWGDVTRISSIFVRFGSLNSVVMLYSVLMIHSDSNTNYGPWWNDLLLF